MKSFNFPFLISTKEIQQKDQTGTENDFFLKRNYLWENKRIPQGLRDLIDKGWGKKQLLYLLD